MKLSRDKLKQIIKEELDGLMQENFNAVDPQKLEAALTAAGLEQYASAVKNSGSQRLHLRPGPNGNVVVDRSGNEAAPQPLFTIEASMWDKVKMGL